MTVGLFAALTGFVREKYGAAAAVADLAQLTGNSGLTFGFDVHTSAGQPADRLVIRLAPRGVAVRGHTDMARQARLMLALADAGVPVPPVRWFGDDSRWFGTSYHVTGRVSGRPFQDWAPDSAGPEAATVYWRAAGMLARIHRVPLHRTSVRAETGRGPRDEVLHWDRIAGKAADSRAARSLEQVRDRLLDTAPAEPRRGLVHGDFRGGNLLFERGRLVAVLDWELAGVGAQSLDVAWLLLYLDAARWYGTGPRDSAEIAASVLQHYCDEAGDGCSDIGWYSSLARYRQVAIILFNFMLHVSGKRPDPHWERMRSCVPILLDDARRLAEPGAALPA